MRPVDRAALALRVPLAPLVLSALKARPVPLAMTVPPVLMALLALPGQTVPPEQMGRQVLLGQMGCLAPLVRMAPRALPVREEQGQLAPPALPVHRVLMEHRASPGQQGLPGLTVPPVP